jgi:hypothetical protein
MAPEFLLRRTCLANPAGLDGWIGHAKITAARRTPGYVNYADRRDATGKHVQSFQTHEKTTVDGRRIRENPGLS